MCYLHTYTIFSPFCDAASPAKAQSSESSDIRSHESGPATRCSEFGDVDMSPDSLRFVVG